ncbi:MAG: DUF362 domain-containing protein, partial [Anaerolineae bacterium]|nr:DUF362 domain-containing protein [Anaerolineae bacterium]
MPTVSIVKAPAGQVQEKVREAMELADYQSHIPRSEPVALKPNLGWDILIPGAISAPWVVEGVIQVLKGYASEIYVVESDQVVVNVEDAVRKTRIWDICKKHNVPWVNMSKGQFVHSKDDSRLVLKHIHIPEILTRTHLVTLPLMKTHNKSTLTGAIKNQWGCLETLRHNFHPVLSEALVDLNKLLKPKFAVMDATIGLEGNGPKSGFPKEMGLVLASGDLVALDATAGQIMGFDPRQIEHLMLCEKHGIGTANREQIQVTGESLSDHQTKFLTAKHNAVSGLEVIFRSSFMRKLIFETPVFNLMTWGARRYYDLWDLAYGSRIRKKVLETSAYAPQWTDPL